METSLNLFGLKIKESMNLWINGFIALGLSYGFDKLAAKQKATQVLVSIQGSLIVSKDLDSKQIFKDNLNLIEKIYNFK